MKQALKEWAVVVSAMNRGLHHVLLRKGGLADRGQEFRMEHDKFLLFPTYEHQKEEMISKNFRKEAAGILNSWKNPKNLEINCWAKVRDSFLVKDDGFLKRIPDLHVWSKDYLDMRMEYKPEKPLYLILIETFKLVKPQTIPNLSRYGGCRSWVDLEEEVPEQPSYPVLPPAKLDAIALRLKASFV